MAILKLKACFSELYIWEEFGKMEGERVRHQCIMPPGLRLQFWHLKAKGFVRRTLDIMLDHDPPSLGTWGCLLVRSKIVSCFTVSPSISILKLSFCGISQFDKIMMTFLEVEGACTKLSRGRMWWLPRHRPWRARISW